MNEEGKLIFIPETILHVTKKLLRNNLQISHQMEKIALGGCNTGREGDS